MKKLYLRDCEVDKPYVTMRGMSIKLLSKDRRITKFKDESTGQETTKSGFLVYSFATEKSMVVREDYVVIDSESPGDEDEIRARDVLGRFARFELPLNDNVRKAARMLGLVPEVAAAQEDRVGQAVPPKKIFVSEQLPQEITEPLPEVEPGEAAEQVFTEGIVKESTEEEQVIDGSYSQEQQEEESDFNLEEDAEELPPSPPLKPKVRKPHPWRGTKLSREAPKPKVAKVVEKVKAKTQLAPSKKAKPKSSALKAKTKIPIKKAPVRQQPTTKQPLLVSNKQFITHLLESGVETRESLAKALMKSGRTEHKDMKPVLILISVILNTLRKKDKLRFEKLDKGLYHIIG